MEVLMSEKENSGEVKQEGEEDTPLYGFILAMNDDQPGSVKRIFGIKKNEVNIGRGSRNDIRLNARMFSRLHATINISREDDGTLKVQLKNQSEQKNATRAPYVLPVGNSVILDSPSMFFLQGRRFQWMEHDGNLEKVGALCSNPIYYISPNMKLGKDVSEGESKPATNVVEYVTSPKQELTPKKVAKSGRRRRSSSNPSLDLRKEAIRRSYRASIAQSLNQSAPVLPRIEEAGDSRDEDSNASCDLIQFPTDDDDSQTVNGSIHDASTQQIVEFGEEESQTPETQNAEEKTPSTVGSPRRSSRRPSITSSSPAARSSTSRRASSRRASMVHSVNQSVVSGMNESGDVSNLDCSVSSAIVNLFSEAENGQQMQESVQGAETQVIEDDAGEKHDDVKEVLESSSVTVSTPSTPKRSQRVSMRKSNVVVGTASPMPTQVAASPKPTPVAASPKPASVAASPGPTPVPASPVPVQALESVDEEMECQSPGEQTTDTEETTPSTFGSPRRSIRLTPSVSSPVVRSSTSKRFSNRRGSVAQSLNHSVVSTIDESGDTSKLDCSVSSAIVNLFSEAENGQQMQDSVPNAETQVIENDVGEKQETDVKEASENSSVAVSTPSTPKHNQRVSRRNSNVAKGTASPMPTPVAASPKPTTVSATPKQTSVAASAYSTPIAASPKPTTVSATPKRTSVAASAYSTPVAASLKPTTVSATPERTSVAASAYSTPVVASPKPSPVPASPVPVQVLESVEEEMECQSPGGQTTDTEEKTPSTFGSPRRSIRLTPSVTTPAPVGRSSTSKRFSSRGASVTQSLNDSVASTIDESAEASKFDCSVSSAIVNLFSEAENGQQMQESVPDAEVIEDDAGEKQETDVKKASENSSVTVSTPSTPKHSQRVSKRNSNVAKGTASPMPTPVAASPQPTTVSATPKRTSVTASAKSTPFAASPKPAPVAASPKPPSVAASPKPTPVAASPKAAPVAASPRPTPVPASPVQAQILESVEEEMECQSPGDQTTDTEEKTPSTFGSPRRSIRLTPSVTLPVGRSSTSKRFSSRRASVAQSLNHSVASTIDESGDASKLDCSVSSAIVNLFSEAENGQQVQESVPDAETQVIEDDAGEKQETGVKEALESSAVTVSTPSTPKRSQRVSMRNSNVVVGTASPMPTPVAASPKPASVAASTRPTPIPASPVPVQVIESVEEEMECQSPEEETTDTEETTPLNVGSPRRSIRLTSSSRRPSITASPAARSSTNRRASSRKASMLHSVSQSVVSGMNDSGDVSNLDFSVSSAIGNLFSEAENGQQMQERVPDAEIQFINDDEGEKHETVVKEALESSAVTVSTPSTPKYSQRVSKRNSNVAKGTASPMPTPVAASPQPTTVSATPKRTSVAASAKSTPVVASPKPTPVAASPKPAPVAASPKPAPVVASSKPSPVPASPVPVQVLESVEKEMECQSPGGQTTDTEEKTPSTFGSPRRSIRLTPSVTSSVGRSSTTKRFSSRRASVAQSLNHSVASTKDESGEASKLDISVSSAIVNLFSEAENGERSIETGTDAATSHASKQMEEESTENVEVAKDSPVAKKNSKRAASKAKEETSSAKSPLPKRGRRGVAKIEEPEQSKPETPKKATSRSASKAKEEASSTVETAPTKRSRRDVSKPKQARPSSEEPVAPRRSVSKTEVATPAEEEAPAPKVVKRRGKAVPEPVPEPEQPKPKRGRKVVAATSEPDLPKRGKRGATKAEEVVTEEPQIPKRTRRGVTPSKQMEEESEENVEVAKDSPVAKKRSKRAASKARDETSSSKSPLPKRGRRGAAKIEEPEQSKPETPKKATKRSASKAKEEVLSKENVEVGKDSPVTKKRSKRDVSKTKEAPLSAKPPLPKRAGRSAAKIEDPVEPKPSSPKKNKRDASKSKEATPAAAEPVLPKRGRRAVLTTDETTPSPATTVSELPKRGKRGAPKTEEPPEEPPATSVPDLPKRGKRGATKAEEVVTEEPQIPKRTRRRVTPSKKVEEESKENVEVANDSPVAKKRSKRAASKAKEETSSAKSPLPKRGRRGAAKIEEPEQSKPETPKKATKRSASKAKEEASSTVETAPSKRSRRGASKPKLATPSTEEPVAPKRSVSKTVIAPPVEEEAPAPKVVKRRGKTVPEPVPEPEQPKPKRGRKVVEAAKSPVEPSPLRRTTRRGKK